MHKVLFFILLNLSSFIIKENKNYNLWTVRGSSILMINESILIDYDLNTKQKQQKKIYNTDKIDLSEYDLLNYDKIYFYKKTGGLLYVLINDSIKRIDKSYEHKLHNRSLKYYFNNTINVLGGYGFFNRRNDIIQFSKLKNEWFSKKITGDFPSQGISDINFSSVYNDNLFFCGGVTGDANDSDSGYKLNGCFKINLKTNKSEKIDNTLNDFFKNKPSTYIQIKDYLYLFFDRILIKVNLNSFESKKYLNDYLVKDIIGESEGVIYFFEEKKNLENIRLLNTSDLRNGENIDFFKKQIPTYFIIVVLFLSILISLTFLKKRLNREFKLIVNNNSIRFNDLELFTDDITINLIKLLLKKKQLSNVEFLSIIERKNSDIGHQNRLRKMLISLINEKTNLLFKHPLIMEKKLMEDKRMKIYFLNNKFKFIINDT